MSAKASEKKAGTKSLVNNWLDEAFDEYWNRREVRDRARRPFAAKKPKRAKPKR